MFINKKLVFTLVCIVLVFFVIFINWQRIPDTKISKIFNKEIEAKYKNAQIQDLDFGIKYIKLRRYYGNLPVSIQVVEVNNNLNHKWELVPAIASENLSRKEMIAKIAQKHNALIGINGAFIKPGVGIPIGSFMLNNTLYTGPMFNRAAMGIFEDHYEMSRVGLNASLMTSVGEIKVDNYNQPRTYKNEILVYSKIWGEKAPFSKKDLIEVSVSNGNVVQSNVAALRIPQDGFVIEGPKNKLKKIIKAKNIRLSVDIVPKWEGVKHIFSGAPYLVKNGERFDYSVEKPTKIFRLLGRCPRTAIGYTKDNHLIILVAGSRKLNTPGLTVVELGNLMKEFGCYNALNLDGGGATTLYIRGKIISNWKSGTILSHALLLVPRKNPNSEN